MKRKEYCSVQVRVNAIVRISFQIKFKNNLLLFLFSIAIIVFIQRLMASLCVSAQFNERESSVPNSELCCVQIQFTWFLSSFLFDRKRWRKKIPEPTTTTTTAEPRRKKKTESTKKKEWRQCELVVVCWCWLGSNTFCVPLWIFSLSLSLYLPDSRSIHHLSFRIVIHFSRTMHI